MFVSMMSQGVSIKDKARFAAMAKKPGSMRSGVMKALRLGITGGASRTPAKLPGARKDLPVGNKPVSSGAKPNFMAAKSAAMGKINSMRRSTPRGM